MQFIPCLSENGLNKRTKKVQNIFVLKKKPFLQQKILQHFFIADKAFIKNEFAVFLNWIMKYRGKP